MDSHPIGGLTVGHGKALLYPIVCWTQSVASISCLCLSSIFGAFPLHGQRKFIPSVESGSGAGVKYAETSSEAW